ncbi:M20/M25/M40 family metallo-hydrolase [Rudanella paleaurantiibacter]|uniref:Carboxypeptidase Q n=1 Tax=Rudanella paleaurantiibacter TaxID=2614655 RepID=A0A7J5U2E5_9BACT|nr:M20/M25/M40 family metallo-hydrolase [Rudanella paleaurantiibacter]KAB7731957.1 M20/M25/M40 family metallo-hydrolase [Rudanella paleaurantiibacter]
MKNNLWLAGLAVATSLSGHAQTDKIDQAAIQKIRDEGLQRSQVMETAFYLTDVNGPRLQGPGFMKAANWTKDKLTGWGLKNARLEPWGDWGKGWGVERCYLAMTAPYYKSIIAVPRAWSGSTAKLQTAEILFISDSDTTALESYRSKLRNKVILIDQSYKVTPSFRPDADRFTDEALAKMAAESSPARQRSGQDSSYRSLIQSMRTRNAFNQKMRKLAKQEGAVGILNTTQTSKDGTLFVSGDYANAALGSTPDDLADLSISVEDYLMLCRLMKANVPVKLELDVKTKFYTDDIKGYNVLAEIPGTDPKLKDEVVMLGAHLDSWHAATGATDNAAGSAVMMEAVRILNTAGLKPRRTIRIALWSGEEQGLHGSKNYVTNKLVSSGTNKLTREGENLVAYYNVDNGTGKIRGIYLQGNDAAGPIFAEWLKPFHDLGATTVAPRSSGGTDHVSFDRAGLNGFGFIQDRIEYDTRTHHTNMDTYDHLQPDDLKQAATVVAAFVYNTAMRDARIPAKAPAMQSAR